MKAQPGEISCSRQKEVSKEAVPLGARRDGFGALSNPGRKATGTPEPYFKQIKDILNNEDREERLQKAGLKPKHRPPLSLRR